MPKKQVVIISKHMLQTAGGNLSPSFWLTLESIAHSKRLPLDGSTIGTVLEEARRRHDNAANAAKLYRSQARAMDQQARHFEDIAKILEPVTKVKEKSGGRTTSTDPDC